MKDLRGQAGGGGGGVGGGILLFLKIVKHLIFPFLTGRIDTLIYV